MRFTTTMAALASLLLASSGQCQLSDDTTLFDDGTLMENNATHSLELVKKLYPDVHPDILAGSTFNFVYGGVYMAGYYSLLGGSAQVTRTINACKGLGGVADGLACVNEGFSALLGHIGFALAGGTYGSGQMAYIANVARQAATINPANDQLPRRGLEERSYTCPSVNGITTNSYWSGGGQGIKISAESTCHSISEEQVGHIATKLGTKLPSLMQQKGARLTQATYYIINVEDSVLMRTANRILSVQPDNCANVITGSGCGFTGST